MTAPAASWRLDRLSTSARDAAEIASLGAGMSLSAWLARLIGETCAAEGVAPPSETPKIIEFTRDIRDRARQGVAAATPRPPSASPATPDPAAVPPNATPTPQQSTQTAAQPITFRPPPLPIPAPSPAPIPPALSNVVMPFTTRRLPTQETQAAARPPAPIAAPAATPPQTVVPAVAAAPSLALHSAPAPTLPVGATMLAVEAIVSANLGSRRSENVPEPLQADIAIRGVREPIRVRRSAADPQRYEIISGHRRWRAAQRVGLAHIPAVVESRDDATAILSSLAENLETGTLSVVDEAQAYLRLLTQCAVDAAVVTAAIGRDRKHIVQSMRLLGLPPLVRHLIGSGMLSRDHAFLLLDAPDPEALADAILAENLDVEAARQRLSAATESSP